MTPAKLQALCDVHADMHDVKTKSGSRKPSKNPAADLALFGADL